ncbi:hypothetical protein ACHAW6_001944 [Cyclotella cf. meneghiniana]
MEPRGHPIVVHKARRAEPNTRHCLDFHLVLPPVDSFELLRLFLFHLAFSGQKIMLKLSVAFILACFSTEVLAQDFVHQRRIPHNPGRPSAREFVNEKFSRREATLKAMIEQRQASIDEHDSGRKLLTDQARSSSIFLLKRRLSVHINKDPKTLRLEIEHEIELYQKMMEGEFVWTSGGMILKES